MRGEQNPVGLPKVAGAVVLLVDGLGASQLGQRAGHARTLAGAPGGSLDAGFPSTTAVALASLTTGALAGEHGIVGYDALVPGAGVRNQLRDWGGPMDPARWQRRPTLFESTPSIAIGEPRHAAGGFTSAVLRGAAYRGGVKETAFSGVFSTVDALTRRGASVRVHDPLYADDELERLGFAPYTLGEEADAVVIQADHAEYRELDERDVPGARTVVDGRRISSAQAWPSATYRVIGIA